jgi:hypothetical protein
MKFSRNAFVLGACLALGTWGCSGGTTSASNLADSTNTTLTAANEGSEVGHEGTEVIYSDDWGAFKSAVMNRSTEGMEYYMKLEGTDAQNLLDMMDETVVNAMFETEYSKLKDSDYNGNKVKEWDYQETGVDDEGNEVGMGLFFYFQEQKEGLRLIGFLAAG